MTKVSERITSNVQRDLYDESLQVQTRRDELAQKGVREREELEHLKLDASRHNAKKWAPVDTSKPCEVAGTEIHIERMKKSRIVPEPEELERAPQVIVVRPFSFELRNENKPQREPVVAHNDLLHEISVILGAL
jgi:hypothetical protein